jgi:AcrR family transcriptional regulator
MPRRHPASAGSSCARRAASDIEELSLAGARRLIVENPGVPLTLRALAEASGVTHRNLSHHFGSLAGLYAALADEMLRELFAGLRAIGIDRDGTASDALLVDKVFSAFAERGLSPVLGWLVRSGNTGQMRPLGTLIGGFIDELSRSQFEAQNPARDALILTFSAYAKSQAVALLAEILTIAPAQRRRYFVDLMAAISGVRLAL